MVPVLLLPSKLVVLVVIDTEGIENEFDITRSVASFGECPLAFMVHVPWSGY